MQLDAPPPEAQIAEIILWQLASRLIYIAATLKLPDYLAEAPRTAAELAPLAATQHAGTLLHHADPCRLGFFTEDADHRFALRPLGAVLKTGTPATRPHLLWEEKS